MHTNFDIDVLRTFIESVRQRSLAKAAERSRKSPSTVTLQIQRLEQQIGVKLFQRAGRGVLPTEHALRLLPYAERVVLANDEGVRAIGPAPAVETIRLAVPADIAETWLPQQLSDFLALNANISVEAQVLRNSEIIERIENGSADLALHWNGAGHGGSVQPVATFPIEWMAAASFVADPQRALPLVVLQSPCLFRDLGITVLEKGNTPLRITMATTGVTGLWSAVAAGLGVTCRVPLGAPEGVVRYTDDRLPELGVIDLGLRTSRSASNRSRDLEAYLRKAIREL
jgi:DNA-binding transcriptional LysR family regulator